MRFRGPVVRVVLPGPSPESDKLASIERRTVSELAPGMRNGHMDVRFESCRIGHCSRDVSPVVLALSRPEATTMPLLRGCVFECCGNPRSPKVCARQAAGGAGPEIHASHQVGTMHRASCAEAAARAKDHVSARFFELQSTYYLEVVRFDSGD